MRQGELHTGSLGSSTLREPAYVNGIMRDLNEPTTTPAAGDGGVRATPARAVGLYAVTNLRAMTAQRTARGVVLVNSFLPQHVRTGQVNPGPHGGTGFTFTSDRYPTGDGALVAQDGFRAVRDADGARAALGWLVRTHP